jgi:hypothetical protein
MKHSPTLLCILVAAVSLMAGDPARSDGGGGISSPYRDLDRADVVSPDRMECEMRASRTTRLIRNFRVTWPNGVRGSLRNVGLAFVDARRAKDESDTTYATEVSHLFKGTSPAGQPVEVDLNRIVAVEVVEAGDKTAQLRISIFPTTDVQTIAANKKSYTDLKDDTDTVVVVAATKNARGEDLALVGLEDWSGRDCTEASSLGAAGNDQLRNDMSAVRFHDTGDGDRPFVGNFALLAELPPAKYDVAFTGDDAWWAVPSVIADPEYPHRRRTKR